MKNQRHIHILLLAILVVIATVTTGCKGHDGATSTIKAHPKDTVYTHQAAMTIYAYQPIRALQIVDSAVIVGNMDEIWADECRARIYSFTQMFSQMDSLLGGSEGVRFDKAQVIGERLLTNDSIQANLERMQDVLEILAYTERMQNDTLGWLRRSQQLVDVCHRIGPEAETDALRTEAEIGVTMQNLGQHEQGMAKVDSVIDRLSGMSPFRFSQLDAFIIASKRKIAMLGDRKRYAETLPVARRIVERLDDYEAHPDHYHDGSHREPNGDEQRAHYIRFYRSQAQSFITAALASLGEEGDMINAFTQIENGVRESMAREHIARYAALQHQIEAERQQSRADKANLLSIGVGILALLFMVFGLIVFIKNRAISLKNRTLVQQISETMKYKELYMDSQLAANSMQQSQTDNRLSTNDDTESCVENCALEKMTDEQLFHHIHHIIIREQLFLDPTFGRQTVMDRFQLSKERVGACFSKGSEHAKLSNYVQQLRMEHAAKLLIEQPDMSIVQIAAECGFSSHKYFTDRFRQHYSMTPSEFRKAQ